MSEQLVLLKLLLNIEATDQSKDDIFYHFLKKARSTILGYCNIDQLPSIYEEVVVDFAVYLYKNRDSDGLSQRREGDRSVTYESGIPENIRLALPVPKIKVGT